MKTEIMNITPDMAIEMLSRNSANRKLRDDRVKLYAKQMKEGKWHLTGQSITFAEDGQLLDGQHRLWAVIESNCTVPFVVVTDAEVAPTYDCGLPRSLSDRLYLGGKKFPSSMITNSGVAIVRGCMTIYNGTMDRKGAIATDDWVEFAEAHMDDMTWCTGLYNKKGTAGVKKAIIYSTLWALTKIEVITRADAEKIISVLSSGMPTCVEDAPLIGFRNALIKNRHMMNSEIFYRLQYAVKKWVAKSTVINSRYETKGYHFEKIKQKEDEEKDAKN